MATEILRPNAAGDYTNIAIQYPDSGEHWDKVDEATPDGDETYLREYPGTAQAKDAFKLQDTAIPSGSTINSVKVYFCVWEYDRDKAYQPFLRLGTNETAGTEIRPTGIDIYGTYSEVLARPGGGSWAVSDLNSLQVAIGLRNVYSSPYCTQVYVEVDYTAGAAWTGKINGVVNPAKINGIAVANIAKVNGI